MADKPKNDIFQTLAKLREKYTDQDDLVRIDSDYQRVRELLAQKGLAENEAMQQLLGLCRRDVINAKLKLATDKTLVDDPGAQRELWFIIEARSWLLGVLAKDFASELETLESEFEVELEK